MAYRPRAMGRSCGTCSIGCGSAGMRTRRSGASTAPNPSLAPRRIRPMMLAIGVALVAVLVARQATDRATFRRLGLVAAIALGIRLAAVTVVYLIAIRTHGE